MIQVQTRIDLGEMLVMDVEILEREDAKPDERRIAEAIEAVLLGLHRSVIEGVGLKLDVVRVTKGEKHDAPEAPPFMHYYCPDCDEHKDCLIRITRIEGSGPDYVSRGIDVDAEAVCPDCGRVVTRLMGFLED